MKEVLFLVCIVLTTLAAIPSLGSEFLTKDGTQLVLNGKPYRAIGVNAPALFTLYSGTEFRNYFDLPADKNAVAYMVMDAEKNGIAFFRFWASPFWPRSMKLYLENPDRYWKSMDEVFELCRKHNIKLVPSVYFNHLLWPMLCGEPQSAIIDPGSRTFAAMRKYAEELLTRYKDDPNVLMWEITNEGLLTADVQMDGRDAIPARAYLDKAKWREKWSKEDTMTTEMWQKFYKETASYFKSIDPNHMVTSGDAHVRDCSESLKQSFPEQVWEKDTLRQHLANNLASQPEPLDVYSFHLYGSFDKATGESKVVSDMSWLDYHRCFIQAAHATQSPVFVGECGHKPAMKDDIDAKYTCALIDMFDREGVGLASIWVWHYAWQPENSLTGATYPALIKRIREFNEKYSAVSRN